MAAGFRAPQSFGAIPWIGRVAAAQFVTDGPYFVAARDQHSAGAVATDQHHASAVAHGQHTAGAVATDQEPDC